MKHALCLVLLLAYGTTRGDEAIPTNVLTTLGKDHPRLIWTRAGEARVKKDRTTDPLLKQCCDLIIARADTFLTADVVEHKKIGRRLLGQSRNMLDRTLHLAAAYRLTRDRKYLARAEQELLAAANLRDWNPSHFLDAAEMACGMGFGYDWLYHDLSETTRATIRKAVIEKAFTPGVTRGRGPWWINANNNWNQVCHGGLSVAAFAMAEDEPEWAQRIVRRAVDKLPIAMEHSYAPDGAYVEGAGYWGYGTSYNVIFLSAAQTAVGKDFGLSRQKGFLESAEFRLLSAGPDGQYFAYGDCSTRAGTPPPWMYWFASAYDRPDIAHRTAVEQAPAVAQALERQRGLGRLFPLMLGWYQGTGEAGEPLPLDTFFNGPNPVAFFRSDHTPDALWVGIKGGNNQNNHCHMDAGEFVLVAGGVRWGLTLGGDHYHALETLAAQRGESLWRAPGRYRFFRYGVRGHSALIINNTNQVIEKSASPITGYLSTRERAHTVVDLSAPWREQARSVKRGIAVLNRRSVLVQDEVTGAKGEILWQMITPDTVTIDGGRATLKKDGKVFVLQILAPEGAVFETLSTEPDIEGENPNKGTARLAFRARPGTGKTVLAVHMWLKQEPPPPAPSLSPLATWQKQ